MITSNDEETKKIRQAGQTPRGLFEGLHASYGFDVDCFASIYNHLLPVYWTRAHDAFSQRLNGRKGFCNPPFGIIRRALEWGYAQRAESFTCFIVPANIETGWFLDLATKGDKHCFDKRIAYVAPPGVIYTQPSFASCLVMYGPDVEESDLAFSQLRDGDTGRIIRPATGIKFKDQSRAPRIHVDRGTCTKCRAVLTNAAYCYECSCPTGPGFIDDDLPF